MSDKQSIAEQPINNSKKISRRDFINPKNWLPVLAAGYVGLKGLESAFYKSVSFTIDDTDLNDNIVNDALELSANAPNSENPNFRPMEVIIAEGIRLFEQKSGSKVFYKRSDSYRDQDYYSKAINSIGGFNNFSISTQEVMLMLEDKFPSEAKLAYFSSNSRISQYEDLFDLSSGFYTIIEKNHSNLFDNQGNVKNYTEYFTVLREEGRKIIDRATETVEKAREINEGPVSTSIVLEHFLTENKGDLGKSIYDTHLYLKFMARNDRSTGFNNTTSSNVEWMKENIKDEYQGPSFDSDKNEEINIIGKAYHSWNLVAMLQFFPLEFIRMSGIYRQLSTMKDQGLGKTRSDLQTLRDLRDIENLLLSYEKP